MATRRVTTTTTKVEMPFQNGLWDQNKSGVTSPAERSPFLPTVTESILLAIYPATLVLGSLYSALHPSTRDAVYLVDAQSYDPTSAPSYFAKKSNVFNVYFVKIGWVWTTLAFFALVLTQYRRQQQQIQATLRYALITLAWVFVTQWFFGPAIIDRSFRWTGGQCAIVLDGYANDAFDAVVQAEKREEMSDAREVFTHAACKAIGGAWTGGHDISGHVFLLILSSAMLWLEALPAVLRRLGMREARSVVGQDGTVRNLAAEHEKEIATADRDSNLGIGVQFAGAVAALSWWMLLMTAAFFHTWFEKLTGSLVAFTALYIVYFLPRAIPALRSVIGVPAV